MEQLFLWLRESRTMLGLIGVVAVFWLGISTVNITLKNYDLAKQIENLEEEIALLELENENFKFLIGYYETDAFLELEARDKLSKVASGESVLVLPDDRYDQLTTTQTSNEEDMSFRDNLNEWGKFLFGLGN